MSSQSSSFSRFWSGLSAEHQSAVLLVSGISILGLSDNFVPYVSDEIGLGQFHFMRSAMALLCVLGLAVLTSQSLRPISWPAVMLRAAAAGLEASCCCTPAGLCGAGAALAVLTAAVLVTAELAAASAAASRACTQGVHISMAAATPASHCAL